MEKQTQRLLDWPFRKLCFQLKENYGQQQIMSNPEGEIQHRKNTHLKIFRYDIDMFITETHILRWHILPTNLWKIKKKSIFDAFK